MPTLCCLLFLTPSDTTSILVRQVALSGRVVEIATPLTDRINPPSQIAPGSPPVLSFRLFEGQLRRRYADLDLVLDDAGH